MSVFLGPIHYQMYGKIRSVTERSLAVFSAFFDKYGVEVERVCGFSKKDAAAWLDDTPLDKLIGDASIHGWLAGKVKEAEEREGRVIDALVKKYGESGKALVLDAVFWHGRGKGADAAEKNSPENLEQMVGALFSCMLDGMPCDSVVKNSLSADGLLSEHSECLHAPNWDAAGVDKGLMCEVARRWMDGFCESVDSNLKHEGRESVVMGDSKCVDLFKLVDGEK